MKSSLLPTKGDELRIWSANMKLKSQIFYLWGETGAESARTRFNATVPLSLASSGKTENNFTNSSDYFTPE